MHLAVRCGFLRSGDDGEFRKHDSVVKCYVVPSAITGRIDVAFLAEL